MPIPAKAITWNIARSPPWISTGSCIGPRWSCRVKPKPFRIATHSRFNSTRSRSELEKIPQQPHCGLPESNVRTIFLFLVGIFSSVLIARPDCVRAQSNAIVMGYSGSGITSDLRRVIEKEKLWDKHGVNVKAIYFNSGGVMTQAIAGGNINISDPALPAMPNLPAAGIMDIKPISVIINRLEHIFVVRKNISAPEELRGKRIAVSRIGSASDIVTRMVIRQWKVDPEKEVFIL